MKRFLFLWVSLVALFITNVRMGTAQVTDSIFLFKITQYICPRAVNGPKGLELYYDLLYTSSETAVNFSTNPLKIRQIGQGPTGIDTTEYLINVNRTLTPNPIDDMIHGVLVLGSANIRSYLLANGLTQIDDPITDVMFVDVNFSFDGNDYLEVLFDASGTGIYQIVDVFGDNMNLPPDAWTGIDSYGNMVSTKGQNLEYTAAIIGDLTDEKWTDPSLRYQTVAKNDRLYGFGILDPYSYNPTPPILDNQPPVVTSNPANNSVNIPENVIPSFTFNEPIFHTDGSQITNQSSATLVSMWSIVPTTFTTTINHSANPVLTVTPSGSLDYDTEYYLQLNPVEDTVGFATTTKTIKFKTIANGSPDLTPPVASFNPVDGDIQIPLGVNPVITFNEPVKKANGAILTNDNLASVISFTQNGQPVNFTATINETKTQITIIPTNPLSPDLWYSISISSLKDAAGNQSAVQTSTFKTVDLIPPVLSFNPINGSTGVSQMITVTITSNEPLYTLGLTPLTNADLPQLIQFVDQNNSPVPFTATIDNNRTLISIVNQNLLAHSTTYIITISPVADSLGNQTSPQSSSFTTILPPQVTFYPADETYGVNLDVVPTISFERPVRKTNGSPITNDDLSSLVSFYDEEMNSVPFTASINSGKTQITITPTNLLSINSVYTIYINSVEDVFGNETTRQKASFITEGEKIMVNFDTAAFWHAEPGKNLDNDYAHHYYYDTNVNAIFRGHYVARSGSLPPQFHIGNYSFITDDGSPSTRVRAIIPSGGVASFKFKVRYVEATDNLLYKVRYSTNQGASWTDLEPLIGPDFLVSNQWFSWYGVVHSLADSIMIDIMNISMPLRRIAIDDFEWAPIHDFTTTYPISIYPVQGGTANITANPGNQAYFKQKVTINVSNIEQGKAVRNILVYDNAFTPIFTDTIAENSQYSFRMPKSQANVVLTLGLAVNTQVIGGTAVVTTNKKVAIAGDSIFVNITNIPATRRFAAIEVRDINNTLVTTTELSQGAHYAFVMPDNGVTVSVILEPIFTITILPPIGGNAQVTTDKSVAAQNESVTINIANVQIGKRVNQVEVTKTDNQSVAVQTLIDGQQYSFVMPNDHVSVQAFLVDVLYTLTTQVNPIGSGTVTGAGEYTYGSQVTLTATPNEGYSFVSWTNAQNETVSTQPEYSFTMPAENITLTANFSANNYTVTAQVNPVGSGTVTGAGVYAYGSQVTLTATPNEGYSFVSWTNAQNETVSTQPEYSFTMPAENITLTANFSANNYTVTAQVNPVGSGTVTGAGVYAYGSQVTLTATPNEGYSFVSWTNAQNETVNTQPEYSFTMPASNIALTANFQLIFYDVNFHVTHNSNPLSGVEIIVEGYNPIYTNQNGDAQISLPNGNYTYTASLSGYNNMSGEFTIQNSGLTINLFLNSVISSHNSGAIKLYPNPVKNSLILDRDNINPVVVKIISPAGIEMKQYHWDSNRIEIDCQNYPTGIYLLQISDGTLITFMKN